jgi:hypothetical protein
MSGCEVKSFTFTDSAERGLTVEVEAWLPLPFSCGDVVMVHLPDGRDVSMHVLSVSGRSVDPFVTVQFVPAYSTEAASAAPDIELRMQQR